MLVIDPDGRIPSSVYAAMEHADRLGARVAGWGGYCQIGCCAPGGPVWRVLDHVGVALPQTREYVKRELDLRHHLVIVSDPPDLAKVALTLAGFRLIGENLWLHAHDFYL